ncbi:DNA methylase [anaerobic digester metagenome]
MQKTNIPQAESKSADLVAQNLEQLKQIFPEVIKEGRVDFEVLNDLLGNYGDTAEERFCLNWAGKANARREAQKRSTGTLRPCPEESVDWDTTENLYIEGDNLEVLKLLQKSYHSRVKMIYIDPPYNTGKDFVYKDNYADNMKNYLELTGQDKKLSTNTESDGRYHSNWLNMMYPRLKLARNLLTDDGVIFISIDDNEVANLRKVCDEIFGEENFVAQFPWRKRTAKSDVPFGVSQDFEWILVFSKTDKYKAGIESKSRKYYESSDFPNRPWRIHDMSKQTTASERPNSFFDMIDHCCPLKKS